MTGQHLATSGDPGDGRLNPAALVPADAARMLSAVGGRQVTAEQIEADLEAGAPRNPNGTISLVQYAAWLVRQMALDAKGGVTRAD